MGRPTCNNEDGAIRFATAGSRKEELFSPLAHLGLGRAYALSADTTRARNAYKDFLALWKDADPDTPILKEARAEYAKMQ